MRLVDAVDLFINDRRAFCTDKTVNFYSEGLSYFLTWASSCGICYIDDISDSCLISYQIYLRNRPSYTLKNTSVNTYMRSVKTFFNYMVDEKILSLSVKVPKLLKDDSEQIFVVTGSEVKLIEKCIFSSSFSLKMSDTNKIILYLRNFLIFHLMIDAALRMGEVLNLKKSHIDLDKNLVYIKKGKGCKDRIVPLAFVLRNNFVRLFECYSNLSIDSDILFFTSDLSRAISIDTIKQVFSKLKKRSGIDRLHPHILRHTFATSFIMGGGDVSVLRVLLGHSDISITQRYLHLAAQFTISKTEVYQLDSIFFQNR